ncbi:MAG: bifunctional DNA-binding transcriptional regulator/O6-methylguanine-DNA methyltransferase Ada [Polyangiaceae bacterium]|nr:bifunctional DNA-binding transcriptional regulator/O6-methylguanine-DNA methyltransferase Ada [Polyangiaceae bacterium]
MSRASDDERWRAVAARDRRADGEFFYAVLTTGIVCRPSCGARLPKRAHVTFFDELASAVRAGFRPCLRCRPDGESPDARAARIVTAACRALEEEIDPPSLAELAARIGASPFHLHRLFRALTGVTPRQYAARLRSERAAAALSRGACVTTALHEAGFSSSGRYYSDDLAARAMAPSRARRKGEGEALAYATARCSLGVVLVAATERGPCAILLGDTAASVRAELRGRFSRAQLREGGDPAVSVLARVVALVERPREDHGLPLDVRGTAFQQRVWAALRALPPGETITYAALASRVGAPRAARAVAAACAANPLAVAIPCHRVVRGDGGLAGYRWGVPRKRALLERERAAGRRSR